VARGGGQRDGTFGPPLGDEDERPKNAGRGRPKGSTGSKRSRDDVKSERGVAALQPSRAPAKRGKTCSSKGIIGAHYDLVEDPSKPAEFGGVGPPGTFYHAKTCLPVWRNKNIIGGSGDSGLDSDDDEDLHAWAKEDLRHLSDFEDVALLEKRFMHDWNVFVRRFRPCADKEIPDCLSAFARFKGKDLAGNRQLRRLFTLHLVNAYDFGVIEARVIDDVLKVVDEQRGDVKR
jgi:VEFS-Box of polycomb protein.